MAHSTTVFYGRVLPERMPITVNMPGIKLWGGMTLDLSVHLSQIIAALESPEPDSDWFTLRNMVEHTVRHVIDLIGFDSGRSFDIDFTSCRRDDGEWYTFGPEVMILFQKKEARGSGIIDSSKLNLYLAEPAAGMALADLREAMRMPALSGFFCYRAIDAMKQAWRTNEEDKDKQLWERLRGTLLVDISAITYIKSHADWARHGRTGHITDRERADILLLTDEIIERFLKYVAGGRVPLSFESILSFPRVS